MQRHEISIPGMFKSCGDGELGMWFSGEHGMVRWVVGLSLRCLFQLEWCYDSMRFGEFHIAAPEKPTAVCGKEKMFSVAFQVLSETWIMLLFRSDHCWSFLLIGLCSFLGFPWWSLCSVIALTGEEVPWEPVCCAQRTSPVCSLLLTAALGCQHKNASPPLPQSLPVSTPKTFPYHFSLCLVKCLIT